MKISIIPSGFKESLSPIEVGKSIEKGIKDASYLFETTLIPMIDGGEYFAETITKWNKGKLIEKTVTGPTYNTRKAKYGVIENRNGLMAIIEMAEVAGLRHVPLEERNPLYTTTYGVGELINDAVNNGINNILIGCGDSGTSDGGIGMMRALGAKFLDEKGKDISIFNVADIKTVNHIDVSNMNKQLQKTNIQVATNWDNILCGPNGVAKVFGPQKGASPKEVQILADSLEHLANLIKNTTGKDVCYINGGGASGGLGASLFGLLSAKLYPRFHIIERYIDIEDTIKKSDLVVTAEGGIDHQTPNNKIPSEVARIAKKYKKPVVVISAIIGDKAQINYDYGIHAFFSIIPKITDRETSILNTEKWIQDCSENIFRMIEVTLNILGESKI